MKEEDVLDKYFPADELGMRLVSFEGMRSLCEKVEQLEERVDRLETLVEVLHGSD